MPRAAPPGALELTWGGLASAVGRGEGCVGRAGLQGPPTGEEDVQGWRQRAQAGQLGALKTREWGRPSALRRRVSPIIEQRAPGCAPTPRHSSRGMGGHRARGDRELAALFPERPFCAPFWAENTPINAWEERPQGNAKERARRSAELAGWGCLARRRRAVVSISISPTPLSKQSVPSPPLSPTALSIFFVGFGFEGHPGCHTLRFDL